MKPLYPRIFLADGISLSVQGSQYAYCSPRIDGIKSVWDYFLVEVGFITDSDERTFTPPDDWRQYSDGPFPSDVYGYVPAWMVEKFIKDHGGVKP
jgi:hypothetical protein